MVLYTIIVIYCIGTKWVASLSRDSRHGFFSELSNTVLLHWKGGGGCWGGGGNASQRINIGILPLLGEEWSFAMWYKLVSNFT